MASPPNTVHCNSLQYALKAAQCSGSLQYALKAVQSSVEVEEWLLTRQFYRSCIGGKSKNSGRSGGFFGRNQNQELKLDLEKTVDILAEIRIKSKTPVKKRSELPRIRIKKRVGKIRK